MIMSICCSRDDSISEYNYSWPDGTLREGTSTNKGKIRRCEVNFLLSPEDDIDSRHYNFLHLKK